jgi:hypothetical protein
MTATASTSPSVEPAPGSKRTRDAALVAVGIIVAAAVVAVVLGWLLWPTAPGPAVLHTGTARYAVTVTVGTPRMGDTSVEIDLTSRTGGTALPDAVAIDAVMPLMGHAVPPLSAVPVGAGRYHADGLHLMMTGPWELRLSIPAAGGVEVLTLPLPVSG